MSVVCRAVLCCGFPENPIITLLCKIRTVHKNIVTILFSQKYHLLRMDYSKFDHIDTDSDEEQPVASAAPVQLTSTTAHPLPPGPARMTAKGENGRMKFEYKGITVYEWEQGLEEVVRLTCIICKVLTHSLPLLRLTSTYLHPLG